MIDPLGNVLNRLERVKSSGSGYSARCPAHDDQQNSLSIKLADNGKVLVHCHAQCPTERVLELIGLRMSDLFPRDGAGAISPDGGANRATRASHRNIADTYDYRDEIGELLFQVVRYEPKGFTQRQPKAGEDWAYNLNGVRRVLYRLPELLASDPSRRVLLVEGEKDADRLTALGFVATTNPQGAGKWRQEYNEALRGRRVVILPDNDYAGFKHADLVAQSLSGFAAETCIVRLPDLPPKGDVSDWFDAGGTDKDLKALIVNAPIWLPSSSDSRDSDDLGHDDGAWDAPIPLTFGERPAFPVHRLPQGLAEIVRAVSLEKQTPAALAAFMTLGVVSAAAAKRYRVEVRGNWMEPLNIYNLSVLPSGNRKSAVVSAAASPLYDAQKEHAERDRDRIVHARMKREVEEARLARLQKELARAFDSDEVLRLEGDRDSVMRALLNDPALQVPIEPRYLVENITPEKLADMMADQDGRMAVISAEGEFFKCIAGRYDTDAIDLVLKGHTGEYYATDRLGREAKHIEGPALTLALSVQPDVLTSITAQPGFRGRGLLARFAYDCSSSAVGRRQVKPPPPSVPEPVKNAYAHLIAGILRLPSAETTLRMSDDAASLFLDFEADLEPRLGPNGDLEHFADWGGKLAGLVARWAGLFHVVETVSSDARPEDDCISADVIRNVIDIANTFLIPHTKTALALMGADPALEDARRVLRAVESWSGETFSRRDLHKNKLRSAFQRPEHLDRPLALLEEYNYIRQLESAGRNGPGRKPSPIYEINPATQALNRQNRQNCPPHTYFDDSDDLGQECSAQNGDDAARVEELETHLRFTTPKPTPLRRSPADGEWEGGEVGIL